MFWDLNWITLVLLQIHKFALGHVHIIDDANLKSAEMARFLMLITLFIEVVELRTDKLSCLIRFRREPMIVWTLIIIITTTKLLCENCLSVLDVTEILLGAIHRFEPRLHHRNLTVLFRQTEELLKYVSQSVLWPLFSQQNVNKVDKYAYYKPYTYLQL